jgi:flagellar hook-length control protein FliK
MPKATAETVGTLATQIVKKVEARTSRFDLELDPAGLGKVNVTVEIGPRGQITAALSFERPQSAAELGARSNELRAALEKAGFDVASGGLSFQSGGGGAAGGQQQDASAWTANAGGRAFDTASRTAEQADATARWTGPRASAGGVDIRI